MSGARPSSWCRELCALAGSAFLGAWTWVAPGPAVAEDAPRANKASSRDWWSLRPLARPAIPAAMADGTADRATNPAHPIDTFLHARLAASGLHPSPEADRRTLIRRLSFDLVGDRKSVV